jgi:hypothetical protein
LERARAPGRRRRLIRAHDSAEDGPRIAFDNFEDVYVIDPDGSKSCPVINPHDLRQDEALPILRSV